MSLSHKLCEEVYCSLPSKCRGLCQCSALLTVSVPPNLDYSTLYKSPYFLGLSIFFFLGPRPFRCIHEGNFYTVFKALLHVNHFRYYSYNTLFMYFYKMIKGHPVLSSLFLLNISSYKVIPEQFTSVQCTLTCTSA